MNRVAGPFDDLEVGMPLHSDGRTVTEADVAAFAALTWDVHPLHTDEEWAAATPFGGRIAHGMLVLSFAMGLVGPCLERSQVVAVRRVTDATFRAPVRPGDTIHLEARIARLVEVDGGTGLVSWKGRVLTHRGDCAMSVGLDLLWRRAPVTEEAVA